jgi:hypothetical protein
MVVVKDYSGWTVAAAQADLARLGLVLGIQDSSGIRPPKPDEATRIIAIHVKGSDPGVQLEPGATVGVLLRPSILTNPNG